MARKNYKKDSSTEKQSTEVSVNDSSAAGKSASLANDSTRSSGGARRDSGNAKIKGNGRSGQGKVARASNNSGSGTSVDANVVTNDVNAARLKRAAPPMNDPVWYLRYPELIAASAKAQFMQRPGDFVDWEEDTMRGNSSNRFIPAIMKIRYRAAFGTNMTAHDPITIASKSIWDRIRDAYSGTIRVAPPDLFMYMMHCDQFYAFIAWCKRLYGVMNVYTPFNHQMPQELFASMFADNGLTDSHYAEWKRRRVEFYDFINRMCRMANKYVVPMGMSIFDRHRFLNENVYQDENTPLAQLYVFAPVGYYKVNPGTETGTALYFETFTGIHTIDQVMKYGEDFYDRLATWQDAKTMNGYILRAYENQWYAPTELMSMDYTVVPVYSQEVLLQIHNARVMHSFSENEVRQDPATDLITVEPQITGYNLDAPMMDVMDLIPDPVTFVIASRLTPVEYKKGDVYYVRCGSEVVVGLEILKPTRNAAGMVQTWSVSSATASITTTMTDQHKEAIFNWVEGIVMMSSFSYAPLINAGVIIADGTPNPPHVSTILGQVTNSTKIPISVLGNLHEECMASELNIYVARNEV